jgi:putative SOS response-associated peptidase YedK
MLDGSQYRFAGLWESWKEENGTLLETFTIITTDPNEVMEPLHDRMPVIIEPKDYDRWLQPAEAQTLPLDLLRPFPAEKMRAWKLQEAGACFDSRPSVRLRPSLVSPPSSARPSGLPWCWP